jgi:hypothetical protein
VSPAAWFAVLSVVTEGAVTTIPFEGALKETTWVAEPVRGVIGLITTVAAVPGPVTVLQVTETAAGVAVRTLACKLAVPAVSATTAISALMPGILNTELPMFDFFFLKMFSATSAGRRPIFRSL